MDPHAGDAPQKGLGAKPPALTTGKGSKLQPNSEAKAKSLRR
ncbi:MAG TPA: hypothetical protein VFZ58_01545 [Candidatus Saccharimonadales bacterium]